MLCDFSQIVGGFIYIYLLKLSVRQFSYVYLSYVCILSITDSFVQELEGLFFKKNYSLLLGICD